jgi:HK97 family phage portal protein
MIKRIFGSPEKRSLSFQSIWGRGLDLTNAKTSSGEFVTYDSALTLSAVYASIRILSDTISTLPLDVFFSRQGSERAFRPRPEWINNMNHHLANHEVLGQIIVSLLLDGNSYIATTRDGTGRVQTITPLDPTAITPDLVTDEDGIRRLVFTSTNAEGLFTTRDITHVRNVMKPGAIVGLSPIQAAREYLGLGIASQKYGASFFANSAVPSGIIEVPGQLSEEGIAQMKAAWNDIHSGAGNARKLAVLTESSKFSSVQISPEDSQFLDTRSSTVADVSRLFGLSPSLLGDQEKSTSWGTGLHEQNVATVQYALRPQVTRLEKALTSIMRSEGIEVAYARFDLANMTRATNDRWETYSKGIQAGVYSINEVRTLEGLESIENGDKHFVPLNLAPLDQVVDPPVEDGE